MEPPRSDGPRVAQFRKVLADASYKASSVKELLESELDDVPLFPTCVPAALRRLTRRDPLSTLVKLFMLGLSVEREDADRALAPLGADGSAALHIVALRDGFAHPSVRLVPSGGLILACDLQPGLSPTRDQVMGVTPSSVLLANVTVRDRVESVLDVGTGGGIQALLAARHAERVVATDLSPRALAFAAFNARLNGVDNVELREGSLLEPVRDMKFDLVVSNPPFVVSPETDVLFRDGGRPGDGFSRELVTSVPDVMNEGGLAQLLVSWASRRDEHWSLPVQRWLEGLGCDAWVLHHSTRSAIRHAALWNHHLTSDAPTHQATFDRWADYLEEQGIEAVSVGIVVLRRRSGENWLRLDDLDDRRMDRVREQVTHLIEAEDRFALCGDDERLLDQHLRPSADYKLEQVRHVGASGYGLERSSAILEGGLGLRYDLDATGVAVLDETDGRRRVRDVAAAVEGAGGQVSREDVLASVRTLIRLGVLVPVEEDGLPSS